jgi:GntR family transcriptional regulator
MGTKPKYEEIKDQLIEAIRLQKYKPGSELPSENELIAEYNVSRITVRRAIDELYRSGYIEKHQGKRGYVKESPRLQELSTVSSYTEEILRQGMTPSRKVLSSGLRLANEEEQASLLLDKASPVFYLNRIIYADEKPLCYTATTLPYVYFRDIEKYDFSKNSLYASTDSGRHCSDRVGVSSKVRT